MRGRAGGARGTGFRQRVEELGGGIRHSEDRAGATVGRVGEAEVDAQDGGLADGDGQAQAVALAAARGVGAEALRTVFQQVDGVTRAVVTYLDDRRTAAGRGVNGDDDRGPAVPVCVDDEVGEDAVEPAAVGLDHPVGGDPYDGVEAGGAYGAFDQRPEVIGVEVGALGAGVQPGDLQQVLGEAVQRPQPVVDHLLGPALRQQLGRGQDAGERRPELMGDIGGEALFRLEPPLQGARHRVQRRGHRRHLVLPGRSAARRLIRAVADPGVQVAGGDTARDRRRGGQPPADALGQEQSGEGDGRGGEHGRAEDGGVELVEGAMRVAVGRPDGHDVAVGRRRGPHDEAAPIRAHHGAVLAGARQPAQFGGKLGRVEEGVETFA
ncbi:hypothetical protein SAMN05216511_4258 [Streptomyces sp. KS_16]|nr:hypothetical protein SAMN05216511_4258 [Streptomyces sp. KS_16]